MWCGLKKPEMPLFGNAPAGKDTVIDTEVSGCFSNAVALVGD